MSFDKDYPNRKDIRKPYYKSKRFDRTCRNHGSCNWCEDDRLIQSNKEKERVDDLLKEYINEGENYD